ncbi:MAG: YfcE family phosphodiesterase [Ruthenibacterium sp.]
MKLVIIADVHGNYQRLSDVVEAEHDAEAFFFLGDGLTEMEMIQDEHPMLKVYAVRGNCDFASFSPTEAATAFGGLLIFYTHGNNYQVKNGIEPLLSAAKYREADIVLYGHTHRPSYQYVEGVHVFNPGALSGMYGEKSGYGILTITDGKPIFTHKEIE